MTKFYIIAALFYSILFPTARAEEANTLSCAMIPALTQHLLRYHVMIHNASDDLFKKATDQMVKRLDPSKALLLQSDVDELKPKILHFFKSMKDKPDCAEINAIQDLMLKRSTNEGWDRIASRRACASDANGFGPDAPLAREHAFSVCDGHLLGRAVLLGHFRAVGTGGC